MRKFLPGLAGTLILGFVGTLQLSAFDQKKKSNLKAIVPEKITLGRPVDFKKDVEPILAAKCQACHSDVIDESKLSLETVKSILKGGKRGPSVVAGQPDKSLMFLLASRGKGPAMPPLPNKVDATALTPKELGVIRQWIQEGAKLGMGGKGTAVAWSPLPPTLQPIYSVALSPWGRYAAAGRANKISIYNVVTGEEAGALIDPALTSIQFEGRSMYPGGASHRDFVHSLAFSPDGNLLASGGYRTVKLWQRQGGSKLYQVTAGNAVTAIAVSADGKVAAIASADNSIQLIDATSGKLLKKLTGHAGAVTSVQFSPDGAKLLSSSADKTARIWDIAKGMPTRRITCPSAVNQAIFNKDTSQIITADADNTIRIWNAVVPIAKKGAKPVAEKPVRELKGHSKPVTSIALILPQGSQVVSGSEDGTVRTWTLSNGRVSRTMSHGSAVTAVAARPDGQAVASAGTNGIGKLWQTSNGRSLGELKGNPRTLVKLATLMEEQIVAKQRVTTRSTELKAADKNVKDREAAFKKIQTAKTTADKAYTTAEKKAKPLIDAVAKAKAALAKKLNDNGLKKKLRDAERAAAKPKSDFEKAKNQRDAANRAVTLAQTSIKRAKSKQVLAKKAAADAAAVQKTADAAVKTEQDAMKGGGGSKPLRSISFSADGKSVLTSSDDGRIQLWSGTDGQAIQSLAVHKAAIAAAAFGPNGAILTGSADKTVAAWNTKSSWKLIARLGVSNNKPLDLAMSPFVGRILSLAFSRDGKALATGGGDPSRSGELLLWDVQKKTLIREIKDAHSDTILGLQFNWEGTQILSGAADKFAKIHDVKTGKRIRSFEGHTHHVLDVAWQADGSVIATAGADNVLKFWNANTGEQKRTVSGYTKQVTSVQFIGTNANIVACAGDAKVCFHRTSNGQRYRNFGGTSDFVYASAAARSASAVVKSVSSEATIVVAGGEDGVLHVWSGTAASIKKFEPPKPPADKKQASLSGGSGK